MLVPPSFPCTREKGGLYRLFQPVWLFQPGYIPIIRGTTCTGAWTEVKEQVHEVGRWQTYINILHFTRLFQPVWLFQPGSILIIIRATSCTVACKEVMSEPLLFFNGEKRHRTKILSNQFKF